MTDVTTQHGDDSPELSAADEQVLRERAVGGDRRRGRMPASCGLAGSGPSLRGEPGGSARTQAKPRNAVKVWVGWPRHAGRGDPYQDQLNKELNADPHQVAAVPGR